MRGALSNASTRGGKQTLNGTSINEASHRTCPVGTALPFTDTMDRDWAGGRGVPSLSIHVRFITGSFFSAILTFWTSLETFLGDGLRSFRDEVRDGESTDTTKERHAA